MNKMKKILSFLLLTVLISFATFSSVFAYDAVDPEIGVNPGGDKVGIHVEGAHLEWPGSGIQYEITLIDNAGKEVGTYNKRLYCRTSDSKNWYGAIKGYGVTGIQQHDRDCPLPSSDFDVPIEDIIGFLELHNQKSMAKKIENAEVKNVRLVARSFLIFGDTNDASYVEEFFWTEAIQSYNSKDVKTEGTYSWNLYTPLKVKQGGIKETDEALWKFLAEELGCHRSDFSDYCGWSAVLYTIEPKSQPADMLEDIKPVVIGKIDNETFNVYDENVGVNGNPIPTSEKVDVTVKSNLYGSVYGITRECTEVKGVTVNGTISAKYYTYDPGAKALVEQTASKTYSGKTTGKIFWLNATALRADTTVDLIIENEILPGGKATFDKKSSSSAVSVTRNSNRGKYTQKSGAVNYTYEVPSYERQSLEQLVELAKEGNAWAVSELNIRTSTMRIEAQERVKELTPFFTVETDTITYQGEKLERNGALVGAMYEDKKTGLKVQNVVNKSSGAAHISNGYANTEYYKFNMVAPHFNKVNNVRIHTPINCEVLINGTPIDEAELVAGENIDVSLVLDKSSKYYEKIDGFDITKYTKDVIVSVNLLKGAGGSALKTVTKTGSQLTPGATILSYTLPEFGADESISVDVTVTAINVDAPGSPKGRDSTKINEPDAIYILSTNVAQTGETEQEDIPEEDEDNVDYKLKKVKDKECGKSPTSSAMIQNDTFNPASGYPIPTSESLYVDGKTTLIAQVEGIEEWEMRFTDAYSETVTIKGDYIRGYSIDETIYEKSGDGEDATWVYKDENTHYYTSYDDADDDYAAAWNDYHNQTIYSEDEKTKYVYGSISTIYSSYDSTTRVLNNTNCPGFIYTVAKSARIENDVTAHITNVPLGGTKSGQISTPTANIINNTSKSGDDDARITHNTVHYLSTYDSADELASALSSYTVDQDDFWKIETDTINVQVSGKTAIFDNNCPVLTTDFSGVPQVKIESSDLNQPNIPLIANDTYTSSGYLTCGSKTYGIPGINSVTIYTPIHNELVVVANSINRLSQNEYYAEVAPYDYQVAKLGDTVTAKVTVSGSVKPGFYSNPDPSKYVKAVKIKCDLCGYNGDAVKESSSTYTHTCTIPVTKVDGTTYGVTSTVIAENEQAVSTNPHVTYNMANNEYLISQSTKVYVVGEIYDFEVRTTDDIGWEISPAEFLSQLPIGEAGGNAKPLYNYGIKLGYRAYFDLKTLGVSNKDIKLKPKFYYVSKSGNVVKNPTIYYRTQTGYTKLSDQDISIWLTMLTTKGEVNNTNFLREQALTLTSACFSNIDHKTKTTLGGIAGLTLSQKSAVTTKYNGIEYAGDQANVSRRWHGELYFPASTVVAKTSSTTAADAANRKNIYLDGYLLVTFENVYSTNNGSNEYLNYDVHRIGNASTYTSQIESEKGTKTTIKMPNGVQISSMNGEIPVLIYDVALRANNDYESSGTH